MDENGNACYEGVLCNGIMSTIKTFTRSTGGNWFEHRGNRDNIDKEQVVKWENRHSMYHKNT